jgi:hypothetical protein
MTTKHVMNRYMTEQSCSVPLPLPLFPDHHLLSKRFSRAKVKPLAWGIRANLLEKMEQKGLDGAEWRW